MESTQTEMVKRSQADQGRRIVVVDDNQGATWMLSKLLTKLGGHTVKVAHDGATAVDLVREFQPEIVILDIELPKMSGCQAAEAIRAMPGQEGVLLVALTGHGGDEDRRRSEQAGFDEHLLKPPSIDQIRAILAHPKLESRGD